MGFTVFIDGQAGTTGLGIAARLSALPEVRLLVLSDERRKLVAARQEAMAAADLVILCLPDEAARESVALTAELGGDAPKLLDASSAHRVAAGWVYGFAELAAGQARRIAGAARVANPGCYATGAIALLRPLVDAGVVAVDATLSINAVSGYSGGGNAMIAAHERDGGPAFALYGLGLGHKHVPEIMTQAGLSRRPIFVPSVVHLRQGMVVSIPLFGSPGVARLRAVLAAHYGDRGQVRVAPDAGDGMVLANGLAGSDSVEVSVHGDDAAGHAVLVARLDNLGKGASGAAVQNARLMLGMDA